MKRLVSAFLAGALALSLAACGGAASASTALLPLHPAAQLPLLPAVETADSDLDLHQGKRARWSLATPSMSR